jgi:DNA replication and repair protein RecF
VRIRTVTTQAFRNLATQTHAPHPRLTVLAGANGQGKTNFLEALYFLAALRSFRTTRTGECIAWGAGQARVAGEVERRDRTPALEVRITETQRRVLVDGKALRSARDYRGDLNAVLFTPDDLALAKGGPDQRRRFLDRGVYTTAPQHLADFLDYERALRARNALLKASEARGPLAEAHADTLARRGARVLCRRFRWTAAIRPRLAGAFAAISGIPEVPDVRYAPGVASLDESVSEDEAAAALLSAWHASLAVDLVRGYTTRGPHADDLALSLGGRPLRIAGSQGQQRAFVLALKLAEVEHAADVLSEPPILLLDDVSSELDAARRAYLFDFMENIRAQVIVTTTDATLLPIRGEHAVFAVRQGRLESM